MVRPLREYLKLEGISVFSFSKRIGTSHQNVANWLNDPQTLCYVQFDVRQKHTILFEDVA